MLFSLPVLTPWTIARQPSLSFTISQSLLKLMSIQSMMPSNQLILCCPLVPLPSVFPSIKIFSNELILCIKWSKYWSFSFSISPSNEYSGLISFRIEWLDLLSVQGILCDPMNCRPPSSYVHGDSPGKNTGVGSHSLSRGSSWPKDQTQVFHATGWFLNCLGHQGSLFPS